MNVDEIINKFKVWLVAQGFQLKHGVNQFDTYAPVDRITMIRLLVAIASSLNLSIYSKFMVF